MAVRQLVEKPDSLKTNLMIYTSYKPIDSYDTADSFNFNFYYIYNYNLDGS